jgi:hypothetical protein
MGLLEVQILKIWSKKFRCFDNCVIVLQNFYVDLLCMFNPKKNETNVYFT